MANVDGSRAAEASEAVAAALTYYPADKWATRRMRMLLQADREKALRQAYVLGVQDGVVAAQEDIDTDPGLLSSFSAQFDAGLHLAIPPLGSLPFKPNDYVNLEEYLAASERYGAGHGLGYSSLIVLRLRPRASAWVADEPG